MNDLQNILDGLLDALELERELGVRSVEFDRALLRSGGREKKIGVENRGRADGGERKIGVENRGRADGGERKIGVENRGTKEELISPLHAGEAREWRSDFPVASEKDQSSTVNLLSRPAFSRPQSNNPTIQQSNNSSPLPLVFLHDRALSSGGVEMMTKIVTAMHQTPETAPILFTGTRPDARVTVVLGFRALKHWFPGAAGSPGQWISPDGLRNVLVTYSPEHILRFGAQTPAVKKLKLEMWTSLKAAIQRIAQAG